MLHKPLLRLSLNKSIETGRRYCSMYFELINFISVEKYFLQCDRTFLHRTSIKLTALKNYQIKSNNFYWNI